MADIGTEFRAWVLAQRPCGATPHALDDDHIRIETDHATAEVNLYPYELPAGTHPAAPQGADGDPAPEPGTTALATPPTAAPAAAAPAAGSVGAALAPPACPHAGAACAASGAPTSPAAPASSAPAAPPAPASEIVEYRISRAADGEPTFFLHFLLDDMPRARELFAQMAEALADEAARTTTHVLLTCTSALTTSMFAAKMGEAAKALSLDYAFEALPAPRALSAPGPYDAVLLAPQVAHMRPQLVEAHPEAAVFEIPAKVFGSYDAGAALRLLLHALREAHAPAAGTAPAGAGLRPVRDLDDARRVLVITLFMMRDHSRLGWRLYDHGTVADQGAVRKPRLDYRDIEDLVGSLLARGIDVRRLDAIGIAVPGVTCRGVVSLPGVVESSHDLGHILARRFGVPAYLDNNCNAAAVGCYVAQDEHESLVFYRHAFGHVAGGFGTVIDGRLLKGRGNLAGEPKHFERAFDLGLDLDEALWSAEGLGRLARCVTLAAVALMAPEAVYLAVDTVDDAEEFRAGLVEELGEAYAPPVRIVRDYVERVYLGELAMCLQKLRDPRYRSLGVGVWSDVAPA